MLIKIDLTKIKQKKNNKLLFNWTVYPNKIRHMSTTSSFVHSTVNNLILANECVNSGMKLHLYAPIQTQR